MNDENRYNYTYSAKEQDEIKRIRDKYCPKEESKMEQLRRLDAETVKKGRAISAAVGAAGSLILGLGMSCCTVWADKFFFVGIAVGIIGIIGICAAYPLHVRITKRERERIATEIIRLTDELMR